MNKSDREFYKSIGICPVCGKNKLYGDEKACPECRAYSANLMASKRAGNRDTYNSYQRDYSKSLYQRRKEQGICVRCGKRKANTGETRCLVCKTHMQKIRPPQDKREQRRIAGTCYFCGAEPLKGMKVCKEHYEISMHNLSKSNGSELFRAVMNSSYGKAARG